MVFYSVLTPIKPKLFLLTLKISFRSTTQRHNPEELDSNLHRRENLEVSPLNQN